MDDLYSMIDSLRSVQHFAQLNDVDLRAIVTGGQIRHFRTGDMIFAEGDSCAGMHVLIRGQVHLTKTGPQGQVNIMAVVNPVIMFNEVAVLDGGPNPVSAIAIQDCLIWQISYGSFQLLVKRYPQLGMGLLRVLASRNRHLMDHYADLSFRSVRARTAKLLLDLSGYGKTAINRRNHSINELANHISSVPEAISRSLNVFKAQGLIQCSRTEVLILLPEELAKLAQIDPQLLE
jgi:CRP-like cAMP-binding protein